MNVELIDLLWSRTKVEGKCWLYENTTKQGYSLFEYNGNSLLVHRLSICIYLKVSYKGNWQACHLCHNKNCWNPLHLYQGDSSSNAYDRVISGSHHQAIKTHCPKGHEYTPENTRIYRDGRYCKRCNYLKNKRQSNAKQSSRSGKSLQ